MTARQLAMLPNAHVAKSCFWTFPGLASRPSGSTAQPPWHAEPHLSLCDQPGRNRPRWSYSQSCFIIIPQENPAHSPTPPIALDATSMGLSHQPATQGFPFLTNLTFSSQVPWQRLNLLSWRRPRLLGLLQAWLWRAGCRSCSARKAKTTDVDWTSGGCSTREVEPCWTRWALGNINIWSEDLGGTKLWCKHCRFTCAMCKPRTMWLLQAGVCHTYNPPSKSHTDLASRLSGNFENQ